MRGKREALIVVHHVEEGAAHFLEGVDHFCVGRICEFGGFYVDDFFGYIDIGVCVARDYICRAGVEFLRSGVHAG